MSSYTLTVTRQPLLAALSEVAEIAFRARLKALSLIQVYVTGEPFGSVPETSAGHRQNRVGNGADSLEPLPTWHQV